MTDYIDSIRKTASPSTVRGYVTIRDNRFASIADKPFDKIKNWQRVIDTEADLASAKTLKNAWGFLRTAMRHAGMTPPDVRLPQLVPPDKPWLEPDEVLRFVELVRGQSFEIPALADAIRSAPPHQPDDPIYTSNANTLCAQINRLCRNNGLPQVGVHGLRHSFASLAFHLGLTEQETMELGGWADYNTMRKIYTHLAAADRLKSQNKMAAFFEANANQDAKQTEND